MSSQPPANFPLSGKRLIWAAIAASAVVRLATLPAYPLMDTTEARYAEIARRMAALGDWVTPWVTAGVPFWAKPPLSFWITAASFETFGISEFAARLPHWICACLLAWVVWSWLLKRSAREATYALALLAGSVLFFSAAGAVMTDMVLALGMTLTMRGFWLALHGPPEDRIREQCLMFLGLAIGLLAKGPIALISGVPVLAWVVSYGQTGPVIRGIRWVRGCVLTLALILPWYAWAESRTPGFLTYFLVGEHWLRFVEPGWSGDLYGNAHAFPRGTIWPFALLAFIPWSLLMPLVGWRWRRTVAPAPAEDRSLRAYLLMWAITPCVVFTAAGNILWTYVLPGLPALAMALAMWMRRLPREARLDRLLAGGIAFTALSAVFVIAGFHQRGWTELKSTKALVADYESSRSGTEALLFFRRQPLSSAFYSEGRAETVREPGELQIRLTQSPVFVAIREQHLARLPEAMLSHLEPVSRRGNYGLYQSSCALAKLHPESASATR